MIIVIEEKYETNSPRKPSFSVIQLIIFVIMITVAVTIKYVILCIDFNGIVLEI